MASAEPRGRGKKPWRARYKKPDGTWGSESGFATKAAALAWGRRQEAAIQEGRWIDPGNGAITLDEWWEEWMPAQEYAPGSVITLSGLYRNHLRPWKGDRPIREIRLLDVDNLRKALQTRLGASAVTNVMSLLKMLMEDAVLDGRIGSSPVVSRRRRGRKHKVTQAKATQRGTAIDLRKLLAIVRRMPDCGTGGPVGMVIILIMAFAGLRWGEVTAMQRKYLALFPAEDGQPAYGWYIVDDDEGGVHYRRAPRALGPPKGYVGRTIELPPFLVELLLIYVASLPADRQLLFAGPAGGLLPHNCAIYDAWRRACDGWKACGHTSRRAGRVDAAPLHMGLRFHDLRHTHKTWLVEDDVPPVARDERLGHHRPGARGGIDTAERGAMDHVYVHATPAMRARLLAGLQRRWESASAETAPVLELISQFFPSRGAEGAVTRTDHSRRGGQGVNPSDGRR